MSLIHGNSITDQGAADNVGAEHRLRFVAISAVYGMVKGWRLREETDAMERGGTMTVLLRCSSTACAVLLTGAVAAAPAWERQLDMKSMADAAKTIGELFAGRRPYRKQEFKSAAEVVRTRAGDHLIESFVGDQQADSKADAAGIASSQDEFGKLARDLEAYATALSSAADRNPTGLGPETRMGGTLLGSPFGPKLDAARDAAAVPAEHAYHLMLQTCTTCHAKFKRPIP